jgi:DNA invertase Pin-like site-specific DNA recombinase
VGPMTASTTNARRSTRCSRMQCATGLMAGLDRVRAEEGKKLGRPQVGQKVEEAIRQQLRDGHGILKVAKIVGCGSGTVQRVKRETAP